MLNADSIHRKSTAEGQEGRVLVAGSQGNLVVKTLMWVSIAIAGISRGLQPYDKYVE